MKGFDTGSIVGVVVWQNSAFAFSILVSLYDGHSSSVFAWIAFICWSLFRQNLSLILCYHLPITKTFCFSFSIICDFAFLWFLSQCNYAFGVFVDCGGFSANLRISRHIYTQNRSCSFFFHIFEKNLDFDWLMLPMSTKNYYRIIPTRSQWRTKTQRLSVKNWHRVK